MRQPVLFTLHSTHLTLWVVRQICDLISCLWSLTNSICPVIGQYWSRDLNTDLWLVNTDHVTWILTSDWFRMRSGWASWRMSSKTQGTRRRMLTSSMMRWVLIGQYWSPDLNTDLWLGYRWPAPPPRLQWWQGVRTWTGPSRISSTSSSGTTSCPGTAQSQGTTLSQVPRE